MSKTCPKCGAEYNGRSANQHDYRCASTMCNDVNFYQSPECVRRERDQLLEQNRELTERIKRMENAGGLALGYASKGDFESADEVWSKAKEAKP